ncbi:hypothetical protein V5F53_16005 [Xanthobacter sp. V4C-4]|uniref:hypothetical protein n=1 Tax=Xanthobacter cornucopiae TaxID=3119924 RepID=UPI00372BB3CE
MTTDGDGAQDRGQDGEDRPSPTRARSGAGGGPRTAVLLALFAAGLALFNFPLLAVWNVPATVLGLPLLPVALFTVWALLIALLARACEGRRGRTDGPP